MLFHFFKASDFRNYILLNNNVTFENKMLNCEKWDTGELNNLLMIILKINPYSDLNIFQMLDCDSLASRRKQHLLQLVYKGLNELIPIYVNAL